MKKTTILLLIAVSYLFTSCDTWLDLRPENEIVLEDYWQTESQATAVLTAGYRALTWDESIDRMLVWGELRSDNLANGSYINIDLLRVMSVNITPTNTYANWGHFYSIINYCNTFLHYAPNVVKSDQNFTESKLHAFESEALTIRALCYFYLVRAFRDVPLVLEPSISDTQDYNLPKSTEREVLDQIINDLLKAQQFARADFGKGLYNKGRVTRNAVYAILADVYLWDQQYGNAIQYCNKIIEDNSFKLVKYDKMISEVFYEGNSTESVFELQFDKDVQKNNIVSSYYGVKESSDFQLSFPSFLAEKGGQYSPFSWSGKAIKESVEDVRQFVFFGTPLNGFYPIYKYSLAQCTENADKTYTPTYRSSSKTVNWILYRLSDIMLMKAEALVQLEDNETNKREALRLVNTTYLRSNYTADSLQYINYSDKIDMESLILRERQRELMFEGKRWFDLMRMVRRKNDPTTLLAYISPKLTGDIMQIKKMSVMDGLYMPVSESEILINPKITQNPFYEETYKLK